MVASYWFTPNYFVETHTPTYGYNVSGNWAGPDNLFAAGGSVQNYGAGVPVYAYLAKKPTTRRSVAVVSYGSAITSSYDACNAGSHRPGQGRVQRRLHGLEARRPAGTTVASAVQRMQQAGSDFVLSCMQESDNITMARDIQQYGLTHVHQLWFDGYDQSLLQQYSNLMQGVYFNNGSTSPTRRSTPREHLPRAQDELPGRDEEVRAKLTSTTGWPSRAGSRPPCWPQGVQGGRATT